LVDLLKEQEAKGFLTTPETRTVRSWQVAEDSPKEGQVR
jgi:hypothetical protein